MNQMICKTYLSDFLRRFSSNLFSNCDTGIVQKFRHIQIVGSEDDFFRNYYMILQLKPWSNNI